MPPKLEVDGTEVLISPSIFRKYRYKLTLFALFGGAESLTYVRRPPASAICRLTYLLTYLLIRHMSSELRSPKCATL